MALGAQIGGATAGVRQVQPGYFMLPTRSGWGSPRIVPQLAFVGSDTTAPGNINVTTVTAAKISSVVGKDSTDVTFTADENFVEYMIRRVSTAADDRTLGTLIEQATVSSTASFTANLTSAELVAGAAVEGTNLVKVFVRDAAGNWSS